MGSSGAQVPTGVSVCAPPAACPPCGHQGLMALDTRCRVEGRKGSPGGWWSSRSDRGLTWPPWPPQTPRRASGGGGTTQPEVGGGRAASRVCGRRSVAGLCAPGSEGPRPEHQFSPRTCEAQVGREPLGEARGAWQEGRVT